MNYHVKKISDSEYHVILQRYEQDEPFVYAKCTGPVPAHTIKTSLNMADKLNADKFILLNLAHGIKSDAERFRTDIDDLQKYDEIKEQYPKFFKED